MEYLDYVYHDIDLRADLIAPFQKWSWSISDESLITKGTLNIDDKLAQKQISLNSEVTFVNLNALGLVSRDRVSEFSGGVVAEFYGSDYSNLSGKMSFSDAFYQTKERYYYFEQFDIDLINDSNQKYLSISAPDVVEGQLSGNFIWGQLTDLFTNALGESYMNYQPISVQLNQSLQYDFTVYHKFVDIFFPELQLGRKTQIKGTLSDRPEEFEMAFDAPELLLFGNYLGGVHILVDNNNKLLQ